MSAVAECYTVKRWKSPRLLAVAVIPPYVGEWLSLVEHLVRDQGVGGSNPLSPTNSFVAVNSSSGFHRS